MRDSLVPMTSAQTPLGVESTLPDHTQLPEFDGLQGATPTQRLAAKLRELNINPDKLV
ncbi:hypothetical protein [Nostoc sp.]|uniref:hypothetical protein n=1 Tax=Nostoc sp. TaxID=1180 RepID=UPI002FFCC00B